MEQHLSQAIRTMTGLTSLVLKARHPSSAFCNFHTWVGLLEHGILYVFGIVVEDHFHVSEWNTASVTSRN